MLDWKEGRGGELSVGAARRGRRQEGAALLRLGTELAEAFGAAAPGAASSDGSALCLCFWVGFSVVPQVRKLL